MKLALITDLHANREAVEAEIAAGIALAAGALAWAEAAVGRAIARARPEPANSRARMGNLISAGVPGGTSLRAMPRL